jgi:CheY-like chemotaxis protein
MSHEIRTPMNAILGMLKLLSATALSERQRDYTAKTEGAARSLLGLLNDILDFSKVEAGKLELDREPFSLGALMADLSVILSSNLGAKDVDIVFDIDPGIPDQLVGDALRLKQILINLAGNAVKFTEHGQVLIAWRLVANKAQSVAVELAVSDSGIGIAPENQARIFEGFSQAESSTTRRFGGTGLGLAICTRLVGLMGGQLALKSALGKGSTFSFQLDLPLPQDAHAVAETPLLPSDGNTGQSGQRRVLLVDDNPVALRAAEVALQAMGWAVTAERSGEQGLAQLRAALAAEAGAAGPVSVGTVSGQPVYDAVYVDWHMPEVDGWQTLRLMRREFGTRPLPKFVMLSAQGRELLGQRSKREQELIDAFLVKPLTGAMFASVFAPLGDAHTSEQSEAKDGQHQQPLAGLHLLVVEDNAINQQVAQELLTAQGAQVTLAGNGRLGVEAIALQQPMFDLVLMDLQMPEMDGLSAARYIRNELALHDLPVVAMTANAMSSDREACLAAGMNEHVGKPFDLQHLVATVLRYCHRSPHAIRAAPALAPVSLPEAQAYSQVNAASIAWPHGVAGASAVQRMGGNVVLYRRTLQALWDEAQALCPRMQALVDTKQLDTLQREAHSLKGLARTVGVGALADCAAQLEAEAQAHASASELEEGVAALEACMQSLAPSVRELLAQLHDNSPPHDAQHAGAALGKASGTDLRALLEALEADDMRALELHAALRQCCDDDQDALLAPLDAAMAQLDFAAAAQACKVLLDEWRT